MTLFLIFTISILLIIIYRYVLKRELYFTSRYREKRVLSEIKHELDSQILSALKKSNFKKVKRNGVKYSAITLPSMSSYSEKISVLVENKDSNNPILIFESKCLFPLQVFDWGKNERNSIRFFKYFQG